MARLLKDGQISEDTIHRMVMQWVNLHKDIQPFILHFPAEGKRTPTFGRRMKDYGMRRGVSDLLIAFQNHGFGGMWLELKSANGIVSKEQKQFMADMRSVGYCCEVAWSFEEAISYLEWYIEGI